MEYETAESLLERGGDALAEGKLKEAIEFYTAAIELDPENHVIYSHRSAVYGISDRFEEALSDAEKCIALKPNWNMGYARRGCALALLDRSAEAITSFKEMERIERGEDCQPTKENNKSAHLAKYDEMLNPYRMTDLIEKHVEDSSKRLFTSDDQDQVDITGISDQIQKLSVTKTPVDEVKANDGQEINDKQLKVEKTQAELKKDAIRATEEKELGNKAYKAKDLQTAAAHYKKAMALDPGNITYLNNMAAVHFELAEYPACVALCTTAVEVGRENRADYKQIAKAFTRCGNAHKKQGQLKLAKTAYEKSMSELRTPEIKSLLSEVEKQIREEERKANIDPVKGDDEKEKGNECFKKGKYADALKHYTAAIGFNPDDVKYYSNRAACYTKLAAFDLGLKDCELCLTLDRTFVKGWIRKGKILQGMQQYDRAITAYTQALELDQNNADAIEGYRSCAVNISNDPEEVRKRAMADPEIQAIMHDPAMRIILEQMQADPRALTEHLKDPNIATKVKKLMESGIIVIR